MIAMKLPSWVCSQVLVVRGSLLVLDVGLLLPLDFSVGQLPRLDHIATVVHLSGASPVPVHSPHELESRDLLISQVSHNLQHFTTVAIDSENFQVQESRSVDGILKEQGGTEKTTKDPFGLLSVRQKMLLHII